MHRMIDLLGHSEKYEIEASLRTVAEECDVGSADIVIHKAEIPDLVILYNDGNDPAEFDRLNISDMLSFDEEQMMIVGKSGCWWLKCSHFGLLFGTDQAYSRMMDTLGIVHPGKLSEKYRLVPIARISNKELKYVEEGDIEIFETEPPKISKHPISHDLESARCFIENPRSLTAQFKAGSALCMSGRYREAIGEFEAVLHLNPSDGEALFNLGLLHERMMDDSASLDVFLQIIRLPCVDDEILFKAYLNIGSIYRSSGDLQKAATIYHELINRKSDYALAYSELGNVLQNLGDIEGAIEAYQQTISLAPDWSGGYINMGNALLEQGDSSGSEVALRRAVDLEPSDANSHLCLGNTLYRMGRFQEAATVYETAIALDPRSGGAYHSLGNALSDMKDFVGGIRAYQTALTLDPALYSAHYYIGDNLLTLGDREGAVVAFKEYLTHTEDPNVRALVSDLTRT